MFIRKYSGVTLIELLLSLTISFVILDALFSIYITCKNNFSLQLHLAAIQENAQSAMQILKNDIESAGFIGCAHLSDNFPIRNHTSYLFDASNKLIGNEDSISIRHMDTRVSALTQPMQNFIRLKLTGTREYHIKEIMMISDCESADIFTIQSVQMLDKNLQLITAMQPLSKNYDANAEVSRLVFNTYFVKRTRRTSRDHQPIYALFIKNINGHSEEIAEDINSLHFNYSTTGITIHLTLSEAALTKDWYTYASY
jgi:hypothetical protein